MKKYLPLVSILIIVLVMEMIHGKRVVNVPLDQRFTTRVAFLNMAKITPFQIKTLPNSLLPSLKKYSPPKDILGWTLRQAANAEYGVISLQSLLYGSLIASRITNDTEEQITQILDQFVTFLKFRTQFKLYCSAVIMRIPHYNADFQQPWYWAQYGQALYTYSYYCDKYNQTKDASDLKVCQDAQNSIPLKIIDQFRWRRSRNHNITLKLLSMINKDRTIISKLYITLDDSAEYGLNSQESKEIIRKVAQYNLQNIVRVYPGADQVSLTLLSVLSVDDSGQSSPVVSIIYRNSSTINYIPKYEGLPMYQTLENQIKSAGGVPLNGSILKRGNVTLLVNNFDEQVQMEAPSQGPANQKDYGIFLNYICFPNKTQIVGLADNRYCNGGDVFFVNYAINKLKDCRNITQWAYAGWNTNGNTLGTVIANSILLWIFRANSQFQNVQMQAQSTQTQQYVSPCSQGNVKCANSYFNMLRILQDKDWQVILRQLTRNYIYQTPGDNINNLTNALPFYENFAFKSMSAKLNQLKPVFGLSFSLSGVYYPWNRTFEIGIYGKLDQSYRQVHKLNFLQN